MRKKRSTETPAERDDRIERKAAENRNRDDAEDDAIDAMIKRSIDLHGA